MSARSVSTPHVRHLLDAAMGLALDVDGASLPANPQMTMTDEERHVLRSLERAANLARHAAEELTDEYLRARDGWPA